jgi:hypothetical protein
MTTRAVISKLAAPFRWLFGAPSPPIPLRIIAWWELRRIPYNIIVGGYGVICLIISFVCITTSGTLQPGEDAEEPLALLFAPFAINFCYTAGWIVDAPLRFFFPGLSPRFTPLLFSLGLAFSLLIATLPAAYWGGYRLLQLLHVIR